MLSIANLQILLKINQFLINLYLLLTNKGNQTASFVHARDEERLSNSCPNLPATTDTHTDTPSSTALTLKQQNIKYKKHLKTSVLEDTFC